MIKRPILFLTLGLAGCLAATLNAQDLDFQDLKKNLNINDEKLDRAGVKASYADMLEAVMPGVVTVNSKQKVNPRMQEMMDDPLFRRMFPDQLPDMSPGEATGSGVLITSDGYILTNNHVIADSEELEVILPGENLGLEAKLVVADPKSDVALIKIEATDLDPVTIGVSSEIRVGDLTFAVGNPFGLDATVTMGIVSALGRGTSDVASLVDYADLIQTDASINRGNSGGALVDAEGRLIGINTLIHAGMTGGNVGVGFAIPSDMALDIVERLLDGGGKVKRGFLGVRLQPLDRNLADGLGWDEGHGVVIADVVPGTPAAEAGLEANDIIAAFDGKEAAELDHLRLRISNTPPNKAVDFKVFRDGEMQTITLELAELPDQIMALPGAPAPEPLPQLPEKVEFLNGVEIMELDEEKRAELSIGDETKGVLVETVAPDSTAADAGLRPGQIIFQVNKQDIDSIRDALEAMADFDGDVLLVRVNDGGARTTVAIRVAGESEDEKESDSDDEE